VVSLLNQGSEGWAFRKVCTVVASFSQVLWVPYRGGLSVFRDLGSGTQGTEKCGGMWVSIRRFIIYENQ
jgi:hypothetical protein